MKQKQSLVQSITSLVCATCCWVDGAYLHGMVCAAIGVCFLFTMLPEPGPEPEDKI